jgi:hypothetical protein
MEAWAIKESRMVAEPITSIRTGASGWTITWRGRGWWQSFEDYLDLVRQGVALGLAKRMPVIPSVKYHLPGQDESHWREDEYQHTTQSLLQAWRDGGGSEPMPIEKDFSPTLAGSDLAGQRATVLTWLRRVPALIRAAAPRQVLIGLKLFNTLDEDAFQFAMLREVHENVQPDFLVYANRLFDPGRAFDGLQGVAYGGPDLSDRNLSMLTELRDWQVAGSSGAKPLEISGTGNICSGRLAMEYALRGCTSFQIHTLFQLPAEEFSMRRGSKVQKAVHRLYFDPSEGFIIWAAHAARRLGLCADGGGTIRFLDLAGRGATSCLTRGDLNAKLA